jgi:hypothetical protein
MKASKSNNRIFSISPIKLDPGCGFKRESPRPLRLRQPDFDERFDSDTLFYDVFRMSGSDKIFMVGPALYNLATLVDRMQVIAKPSNEVCRFRRFDMDRMTRVVVDAPPNTLELALRASFGEIVVSVSGSEAESYKGLRVLCTISKNNHIDWICDWARFNRDIHGAQAILLYDNDSSAYSLNELSDRIGAVGGLSFVGLVPFPFRFGPPGHGLRKHWDSNFLQISSLEHARWRFLSEARSFLNSDVDELVLSAKGDSLFEAAEKKGLIRFFGSWVPNLDRDIGAGAADRGVRHFDFRHVEKTRFQVKSPFIVNRCQPKWAVAPQKAPWASQLTHHRIKNWWRGCLWSRSFSFRHFRGLSTGWKYDRSRLETFDPIRHRVDTAMLDAFRRVDWQR